MQAGHFARVKKPTAISGSGTLASPLQQVDRTFVRCGREKLSYFAGCDYFRLSSHPLLLKALCDGLKRYGLTVAASRATTGNHELYEVLEKRLAAFFDAPAAVLVSTGYSGNLAVAQALAGSFSHALIDERAHASLVDAAHFLDCPVIRFQHRSAEDLARNVQRIGRGAKPILLTDGLFSHDGSIAPLRGYPDVLPPDAVILLDDAHGAGVLGKKGRGTPEHTGFPPGQWIQTIALSKAFGAYGGAILCSVETREKILSRSRLFNGNTPLPLPLAHAALKALELLARDRTLRPRLWKNVEHVKSALRTLGAPVAATPAPIVPLIPSHPSQVAEVKERCIENGIFPSFIRYPGGPEGGYFRFAISSEHSRAQVDALINVFRESLF